MTITPEDHALLRRPFTAEAVKFRIDRRVGQRQTVLTYVDSRLVAERLSEVDPNWSGYPTFVGSGYESGGIGLEVGVPVAYELTVKGSSRTDVGQIGPATWDDRDGLFKKGDFVADDKHAKTAVSDALKRAAVLFGVGSYLYTLGDVFIDTKKHTDKGEGKYLNAAGYAHLRKQYNDFISKPAFVERFGTPIAYGDELKEDSATVPEPEADREALADSTGKESPAKVSKAKSKGTATKAKSPAKTEDPPAPDNAAAAGDPNFTAVIEGIFLLLDRSPEAGAVWLSGRSNKKLAVKKTLKTAVEKGADKDSLRGLLTTNGLDELLDQV